MPMTSHSIRLLLASSASTAVAALFVFACGSDEVGPADSDENTGGTVTRTSNTSKSTGASNTGAGGMSSNEGGSQSSGGRVGAPSQGGRTFGAAQGGVRQFERGGAPAVQTTEGSTCRGGIQDGDMCAPEYDRSACVRFTRTCQCDVATRQWACTPTPTGSGGAGASGGQGSTNPSFAGRPGSTDRPSIAGSTQTGLAGAATIGIAGTRS
jgi:hypothetical protein